MKKSELNKLVKEVVTEMFDSHEDAKYYPNLTKLDPNLQKKVETLANTLHKLHSALKKEIVARYGQRFKNFEIYIEVDAKGNPEIQISGASVDDRKRLGGGLEVVYPKRTFGIKNKTR